MPRFVATHRFRSPSDAEWQEELERIAQAAHELGARPVETLYSRERLLAYTIYDALDAESIQAVHERARAAPAHEIVEVEQVFTELLHEPRRERFA